MKKTELLKKVEQVEELLKVHVSSFEELRIEAESSFSEAVIIGSREAYVRGALAFLRIAVSNSGLEAVDVKPIYNELGAVWPVAAYVTETEEDAQVLAAEFSCE